jgi:hypothetical protein
MSPEVIPKGLRNASDVRSLRRIYTIIDLVRSGLFGTHRSRAQRPNGPSKARSVANRPREMNCPLIVPPDPPVAAGIGAQVVYRFETGAAKELQSTCLERTLFRAKRYARRVVATVWAPCSVEYSWSRRSPKPRFTDESDRCPVTRGNTAKQPTNRDGGG